jgi:hypothetical protein
MSFNIRLRNILGYFHDELRVCVNKDIQIKFMLSKHFFNRIYKKSSLETYYQLYRAFADQPRNQNDIVDAKIDPSKSIANINVAQDYVKEKIRYI